MKKLFLYLTVFAIAALTLTGCDDVPMPYNQPGISTDEPGVSTGSGTAEDPYNVAAALERIQALSGDTTGVIYVKGVVMGEPEIETERYGNASYYITDSGDNQLYIFQSYYLGNRRFTTEDNLAAGDTVVICGRFYNYRGNTPETVGRGTSYIYSLNGQTSDNTPTAQPSGDGTLANPYNIAAVQQLYDNNSYDSEKEVYVKGTVSAMGEVSTSFGNATYYLSDDGTTANQYEIYRGLYLNGDKFTSEDQLKVGDVVVVCGKLTMYRSTKEMAQGSKIISINGNTGGDTPTVDAKGSGTEADPYNAAGANARAATLGDGEQVENVYVSGKISRISQVSTSYGNAQYYISDDGTTNGEQFYVFRGYYLNGDKFTSENQIKVGQSVTVRGTLVNYKGNTPEMAQGSQIVSISDGGSTPDTPTGEADLEITASSLGLSNAGELSTYTVSGTTLTFSAGSNTNSPKYYTAGGGTLRLYPGNGFTVNAGSNSIASIVIECDSYNGTSYTAEGKLTASSGSVSLSNLTFTVSGINSTSVSLANGDSGSGGKTQLRIKTIKITFVK